MMKHINIKKAISFFMAVCLLAGNSYTGGSTSVSIAPVVQETSNEDVGQETAKNINTESRSNVFSEAVTAAKGFFSNFGNRVRVANAAGEEYEYVLRFTAPDSKPIKNGDVGVGVMAPGATDTITIGTVMKGTENTPGPDGSMENIRAEFKVVNTSSTTEILKIKMNSHTSFTVVAEKPGWARIEGQIWKVDADEKPIAGTTVEFSTTFLVKAELVRKNTDKLNVWKDIDEDAAAENRILVLDPTELKAYNNQYQLVFEGINSDDPTKANEISKSIKFTEVPSSSIASLDENGLITIVGAGITTFAIQNYVSIQIDGKESEQEVAQPDTVTLIVLPTGAKEAKDEKDYEKLFTYEVDGVSGKTGSEFTLYTNAFDAENRLIWEVYYGVGQNKKLVEVIDNVSKKPASKLEEHSLFDYYFDNKNIIFTDVKAGTYQIKAYVTQEYETVECLTVDVIVWLNLSSGEYYVNVGDYYDIAANSNIPEGMYKYVISGILDGTSGNSAVLNPETGIINAIAYGEDSYQLIYKKDAGLYSAENAAKMDKVVYKFQVIDTLSISPSSAIMYTGGEMTLKANTTQHGTIFWEYGSEADKEFIEIGANGVIRALKKTPDKYEATVVAYQIVDGVTKRAECKIQIYETASKIELLPTVIEIAVGEIKTVEAILVPDNLNRFNLRWQSMNETIFTLGKSTDTNIQIVGKAPGTATLIAINQDNGAMGYCQVIVKASVESVTLSKNKITGLEGTQEQLEAKVLPEGATNKELFWWSVDPAIATVDQYGKVSFKKEGTTVIFVRSVDNPEKQASCTVVVSKTLSGIRILEDTVLEMYVGETHTIPYKIEPENASNKALVWESFDTKVVTVDAEGRLTAKSPGTAMVMVMSKENPSIYVTISVTVKQKATSVTMNYKEVIMNVGDYFDMEVTIAPADSTEISLTWESLDTKIVTVSSTGRFTARAEGSAIVLVKTENGVISYCTVKVIQPVNSLELDPRELVMDVGEVFTIDPVFKPAKPTNMDVKWTSFDTSVATVNSLGEVEGISRGSTVITCESVDGGFRSFCLVTVVNPDLVVTITPDNYRLGYGKSYTLEASVLNKGKEVEDIELIWSSSDESVCSVDEDGKIYGEGFGDATITVMIDEDGVSAYATCQVRVVREVTSIRLNHTTLTIIQGHTASLKADVQPSNAAYTSVLFSSEDEAIASIDEDGMLTGITPGATWIWAKAKDNSGKYARCYVNVIAPIAATGITISDKQIVLVAGESKQMVYSIKPNNTTDDLTWSSGDEAIATVSGDGKITAHRTGTTNIIAMTSSGKTAQVEVIVLGLSRTSVEMPLYDDRITLYVDGATTGVRWDSENSAIVEVNNGKLTSRKIGTTYVTATVNGRKLRCKVTVVSNKKK